MYISPINIGLTLLVLICTFGCCLGYPEYINGRVDSAQSFNNLLASYGQSLSVVEFNMYRRNVGWGCCIRVVPISEDTRINGRAVLGCSYSNVTTTIYSFTRITVDCEDAFWIEYGLLLKGENTNNSPQLSANEPFVGPIIQSDIKPETIALIVIATLCAVIAPCVIIYGFRKLYKLYRRKPKYNKTIIPDAQL